MAGATALRGVAGVLGKAWNYSGGPGAIRAARSIAQVTGELVEREARKPEVMMRLTTVYAQYKTMDARQAAIRAEQNSIGNVVVGTVAGSASGFLGNRMALDSAARSAFGRWR